MLSKGVLSILNIILKFLLHKIGYVRKDEAEREAERLLEEARWKAEASFEIERKELEYARKMIEHDMHALEQYANLIGVPIVKRKLMH